MANLPTVDEVRDCLTDLMKGRYKVEVGGRIVDILGGPRWNRLRVAGIMVAEEVVFAVMFGTADKPETSTSFKDLFDLQAWAIENFDL